MKMKCGKNYQISNMNFSRSEAHFESLSSGGGGVNLHDVCVAPHWFSAHTINQEH